MVFLPTADSLLLLSSSAPLVFQDVQPLLVLGLEGHDKVLRRDLPSAVLVHLAHEDVVQAWQDHTENT